MAPEPLLGNTVVAGSLRSRSRDFTRALGLFLSARYRVSNQQPKDRFSPRMCFLIVFLLLLLLLFKLGQHLSRLLYTNPNFWINVQRLWVPGWLSPRQQQAGLCLAVPPVRPPGDSRLQAPGPLPLLLKATMKSGNERGRRAVHLKEREHVYFLAEGKGVPTCSLCRRHV